MKPNLCRDRIIHNDFLVNQDYPRLETSPDRGSVPLGSRIRVLTHISNQPSKCDSGEKRILLGAKENASALQAI